MSFTCKHLTESEILAHIDNGDFRRLYDASKDKIESGNYDLYDSTSDIDDDSKYNHWCSLMLSYANSTVIDKPTHSYFCIGVYKNGELCLLSANYYDSEDNSYSYCHALLDKINDSKSYAFTEEFWVPQNALMKSVGANKMVFYSTQGGSLSFRAKTAQGIPSIFDYSGHIQTEEEENYDIDSSGDSAPTEDGSTKENEVVKVLEQKSTTIKTVRPLL